MDHVVQVDPHDQWRSILVVFGFKLDNVLAADIMFVQALLPRLRQKEAFMNAVLLIHSTATIRILRVDPHQQPH